MLQALPALFCEPRKDELENAVLDPNPVQYAAQLESALIDKQDLIIDFTSLKTCLDPTSTFENHQQAVSFNHILCACSSSIIMCTEDLLLLALAKSEKRKAWHYYN